MFTSQTRTQHTFSEAVLHAVRCIPYGKVASYGQIALLCGLPRAARQVGWVLSAPEPVTAGQEFIPWWRVVNNAGRISIKGNIHVSPDMQRSLLQSEGIPVDDHYEFDIESFRWEPTDAEITSFHISASKARALIDKGGV